MSLEALQGSIKPFDTRIHAIRPHPGHGAVAANVRFLLEDSEILESHRNCGKVQDPYCLRCVPQVHGASRDALAYATGVVETEINGVTDNPLVFTNGDIVSGAMGEDLDDDFEQMMEEGDSGGSGEGEGGAEAWD